MEQNRQRYILPNGVRILTERMEGLRSAALGIWVATGSRDETASQSGAAHFIEHMVFKGTRTHTAAQMAERMDMIGGQINAFTSKESTCFYARALDIHLLEALDILCSMLLDTRFAQEDVETERGVILEEIGMYADDPADLVNERLNAAMYRGCSLARPILGKRATLEKMTGQWLRDYRDSHYLPDKIVVALAGSFDNAVVDAICERFSALPTGKSKKRKPAQYNPALTLRKKAIEQNHLMLAFPYAEKDIPTRYETQLLSSVLGGGMSSRLFQEVREKRGLCYTIYSSGGVYEDIATFQIYTALNRETEGEALSSIRQVVEELVSSGVSEAELERAREQSKANVLMGLESTMSRMTHLARSELLGEPILTPDEIIAAHDAVTREAIRRRAEDIFRFDRASFSAVGRVAREENYRALL